MDTDVYTDKAVVQALAQFVPLKVQPNQHPELTKKFRILGTPMIYVIDANEKVWGQVNAPVDPQYFIKLVNEILAIKNSVAKTVADSERIPSVESLAKLALMQAYQLRLDEASATVAKMLALNDGARNDIAAHSSFILAQAFLFKAKIKESEKYYLQAHDLAQDPVELSAIRSSLASVYMLAGRKADAIKYFEMVLNMKDSPEIDKWCANYQLRILKK